MRIKHRYLTFDKNSKLVRLLDKLSLEYNIKEKSFDADTHFYSLEFFLYEDNPNFSELKQSLDRFEIIPQIGTEYEKSDYINADWFIVSTGEYQYPQPENDFGYLQATFNLNNYCRLCGIGKIQNAPYRLKTAPKQPNSQFWGLHWEFEPIFIREEAKRILEREQIRGIYFSSPVIHKTDISIPNFYQLHIDTILNSGFDCYNSRTITCKINNEEGFNEDRTLQYCSRTKFHHPMIGGYLFDEKIFSTDSDIVQTNEYFGSGRSAARLQIVSARLKNLIETHKLKGLRFTPVVHSRLDR